MATRKGFYVSDTAVNVTTSWQAVAVTFRTAEARSASSERAGAPHIWAIECDLSSNAGPATYLQFGVTYDAAATKFHSGPSSQATLWNPTGTKWGAAVKIDAPTTFPAGMTVGSLQVWVKGDAACVIAANGIRLVWTDEAGG